MPINPFLQRVYGHIFDGQYMGSRCFQFLRHLLIIIDCIFRPGFIQQVACIAESCLCNLARVPSRFNGHFHPLDPVEGYIGQPYGGFPEELQRIVLKERKPITVRPGELLDDVDFEEIKHKLNGMTEGQATMHDALAFALYPKVFEEYSAVKKQFGDVSVISTPEFLFGMRLGQEIEVEIERGKTLIVKLVSIGEPQSDGTRIIYFEMNGQPREVLIQDMSVEADVVRKQKADPSNDTHIAATMPGTVLKVAVSAGAKVKRGEHLLITEAMKMETTIQAPFAGTVKAIHVGAGEAISTGDLLLELEH